MRLPGFFAPLGSVQNDMNMMSFLTATTPETQPGGPNGAVACRGDAAATPGKLFRTNLAEPSGHGYYFVYMDNLTRKALNVLAATAALYFGLAVGAPAQDSGGRSVPAALPRQSAGATSHQERTTSMQTARHSPDVTIPPLDAAVPAHTETATFGLG
jgi:hypothetical protein